MEPIDVIHVKTTEATGEGYVCCVCGAVLDVHRELEDHMLTHDIKQTK